MIKSNLAILLAEKGIKISRMSVDTGISRTTLTALAQNEFQGIQMETLNTICNYFRVTPDKVIEHSPIDVAIEVYETEESEAALNVMEALSVDALYSITKPDCEVLDSIKLELFLKVKTYGQDETSYQFEVSFSGDSFYSYSLVVSDEVTNVNPEFSRKVYSKLSTPFQNHLQNQIYSKLGTFLVEKTSYAPVKIKFDWSPF